VGPGLAAAGQARPWRTLVAVGYPAALRRAPWGL